MDSLLERVKDLEAVLNDTSEKVEQTVFQYAHVIRDQIEKTYLKKLTRLRGNDKTTLKEFEKTQAEEKQITDKINIIIQRIIVRRALERGTK